MRTTTTEKSISSAALITLINNCRERQARASGVSFPSQTFPCIDQADINQKAKELLSITPKASSHIFSQRQAHIVSSSYGPSVQAVLFDFFENQAVAAEVEPAAQQATHGALPAMATEGAAVRTMTSREVAELAGKQHTHVMRDIRTMMEAWKQNPELDCVCSTTTYSGSRGQKYEQYELDKNTCLTLVGRYKLKPETMMAFVEFFRAGDAPMALYQGASQGASTEGNVPSAPVRKAKIELPLGGGYGVSMSSLEISELTGSRHAEVKRSIERLATKGVISLSPTAKVKVQRERREELVDAYLFSGDKGRRDSIIVVAQLCPEFTATIVDRWQELEAQQAMPYGQMPVPMSQMFSMFSEGYGKLEHQLQQQAADIASLKATVLQLQHPAPKPRKDPNRIPGPLDWQLAKTIQSIRFNFSIAPHEIGLERFYLYLHGLKTESERADALRAALHLGIKIDNTMPTDFPVDAKNIRFKFCVSENDPRLKDVLDMLIGLSDDKARRTSLKRYLVAKSTNTQTFNLSVSLAPQHKQEQAGLF